jgi:hypothetical protein
MTATRTFAIFTAAAFLVAAAVPAFAASKNVSGKQKSAATSSKAKNVSGAQKSRATSSAARSRANSKARR